MRRETENLLADVVSVSPEQRAHLLAGAMRASRRAGRRRRVVRRTTVGLLGGLALLCAGWFLERRIAPPGRAEAFEEIRTKPATATLFVHTQAPRLSMVRTMAAGAFVRVNTDPTRLAYKPLNDAELPTLFPGRSVMLLRDSGRTILFIDGVATGWGGS